MKDDCNICGKALAEHRDGLACCPLCGEDALRLHDVAGDEEVICFGCGAAVIGYANWNRRAETVAERELAELRDAMMPITRVDVTSRHAEITAEMHAEIAHRFGAMMVMLLRDAPNYQEMKLQFVDDGAEYVVTVMREDGKTPHQMREIAERKLAVATAENERLQAEIERLQSSCTCQRKLDGPPTEPGWYWMNESGMRPGLYDLVSVDWYARPDNGLMDLYCCEVDDWRPVEEINATWYGPICEPEEG